MANEKTPVVWDDDAKKHRPLGSGEKMGGLSASSMISSDSGNLLQQGSDGLMLVTGSSLADPRADNLLEESENGKLQVTSDRVVEWLEGHPQAAAAIAEAVKVVSGDSGNVITAGTDKGAFMSKSTLASAVSTMSAAQLTTLANALRKQGGGLSVGSDGKLSVDFGSMDPAIMRSVVLSMVQQGGGIAVDQSGKLYVDFDNMPTDKFEALLKSLKMQVPLEANMHLYVDTNGSAAGDSIIDGRGTEAKPFKTIQACVNYATQNYAVGRYTIYIHVKSGTYVENLSLPLVNRTSGGIRIMADNDASVPVIRNASSIGELVYVTGAGWSLYMLDLICERSGVSDGFDHFPSVFHVEYGASATVYGCSIVDSFIGAASTSGHVYMRTIEVRGGSLSFSPITARGTSIRVSKGNANGLVVFSLDRSAFVSVGGSNNAEAIVAIESSGIFDIYVNASSSSNFRYQGGSIYHGYIEVPSGETATGKKYSVSTGSGIDIGSRELPGDVAGTAQDSTYGWYIGG